MRLFLIRQVMKAYLAISWTKEPEYILRALAAWMVMQRIADVRTWPGRGVTAADGSLDMFPMS